MKRLGLAAVAVALALVAAGCTPTAPEPAGTAASGEPQSGGTILAVQRYAVPGGIDFLTNHDRGLPNMIAQGYSTLVDFDADADVVGVKITPDLAEDWDISDDGLVYTFHLDPDARFHDIPPVNGRPVTAEDVVATFEAIIRENAITAYQFTVVESIEAIDDRTVEFRLSEPMSPMLENLAMSPNYIVPIEGIEGDYDMDSTLIGSGPFILRDFDPESIWRFERNPDYFKDDLPFADEFNILIIPDGAAIPPALRSGQVNYSPVAQRADVDALVKTGRFESVNQPLGPELLFINTAAAPFDDIRVRKAIAQAIDWDGMGSAIRGDYKLTSVIPPQLGGMSEDELRRVRPYDPDSAQQLLAEAGYPDGFSATMVVQQFDGYDVSEAEWIAEDLKKIGIDLQLELVDSGTYNARQQSGEFELMRGLRTVPTADRYMNDYLSTSGSNFSKVDDPKIDELIQAYRSELDQERRNEIASEFTTYFETEVLHVIAGPMTSQTWVWSTGVHNPYTSNDGLAPSVFGYGNIFEQMWLVQ